MIQGFLIKYALAPVLALAIGFTAGYRVAYRGQELAALKLTLTRTKANLQRAERLQELAVNEAIAAQKKAAEAKAREDDLMEKFNEKKDTANCFDGVDARRLREYLDSTTRSLPAFTP